MKRVVIFVAAAIAYAAVVFAGALFVSSKELKTLAARHAEAEARLVAESNQLKAGLAEARNRPAIVVPSAPLRAATATTVAASEVSAVNAAAIPNLATAPNVIARMTDWSVANSTNKNRDYRPLIGQLEKLVEMGPAAVPTIRDFLQQNQDVVFETQGPPPGKGPKWKQETAPPASMRAGLIDSLKRIGGSDAEQLLAETLTSTGRGYEVFAISRALEGMAPGKYRDTALATAQNLLANAPPLEQSTRLDKMSKDYLNDVVKEFAGKTP